MALRYAPNREMPNHRHRVINRRTKWDSGSGTYFGVDPKLDMIYILLEQTQNERGRITPAFRKLVNDGLPGQLMIAALRQAFVGNIQHVAAGLAMHRIDIVTLQSTGRAGKPYLVRAQQRTGEIEEQRHAENHDDDGDHAAGRARQGDIAEAGRRQRRHGEVQRIRIVRDLRIA